MIDHITQRILNSVVTDALELRNGLVKGVKLKESLDVWRPWWIKVLQLNMVSIESIYNLYLLIILLKTSR